MTRPVRVVDTGLLPARRNVSITAALAEMHCADRIADTFRFHVYPRSVLIGHHQNFDRVVEADYCRRFGIDIARRVTGGGAVYMNPGILAWDMVVERARFGARLADVMEVICTGLAAGLSRLGLPARFRPLNEIEISGRKIAGCSGIFMGPTLLAQGTILVDFDMAEMARALVRPPDTREKSGDAQLAARVSSLKACLGYAPPLGEVKRLLIAGLTQMIPSPFEEGALSEAEMLCASHLHDTEYGKDDFVRGDVLEAPAWTQAGVLPEAQIQRLNLP